MPWQTEDGYVVPVHEQAAARDRHDTDGTHFFIDDVCQICDEPAPSLGHPAVRDVLRQLEAIGFQCIEGDDINQLWSKELPNHPATYIDINIKVSEP